MTIPPICHANPTLTACLLCLGSNYQPKDNLALALQTLQDWENCTAMMASDVLRSADISQHLSDYSNHITLPLAYQNQMLLLQTTPTDFATLQAFCKGTEMLANRHQFAKPIVTLDMDILAIFGEKPALPITPSPANQENCTHFSEVVVLQSALQPQVFATSPLGKLGQIFPKIFSTTPNYGWLAVSRRLPLANHEVNCLQNLLEKLVTIPPHRSK